MKLLNVAICAWAFVLSAATPAAAAELEQLARWNAASEDVVDHSAWRRFLSAYVKTGGDGVNRVRYDAVASDDRKRLDDYINALAARSPARLNRNEAFAYWVNLYNALTVRLILDHYPVQSIREIKPHPFAVGPWKMELVTIAGVPLSLDDIEHGLLRAHWRDPRVHYAVNCASISCPNLLKRPFTSAELDSMLEDAARSYVNHPRGVRFARDGTLILSSIYEWYAEDFGADERDVIAHLLQYARPALAAEIGAAQSISDYEYDWSLNETPEDELP